MAHIEYVNVHCTVYIMPAKAAIHSPLPPTVSNNYDTQVMRRRLAIEEEASYKFNIIVELLTTDGALNVRSYLVPRFGKKLLGKL